MNKLQIFENAEFGSIRTVQLNRETYFVGKDIAEALKAQAKIEVDKRKVILDSPIKSFGTSISLLR